ncbi:MAG: ABC transporter permease [Dehalococcoidia bacterium]
MAGTAAPTDTITITFERQRERSAPVRWLLALGKFARAKPLGFFGLVVIVVMIVVAIFAPQIATHPPNQIDLRNRLEGPSAEHWLGTDATGKDVFSRLVYGARISIFVGFGAVAISTVFATLLGVVSGYLGGWFDTVVQRFVDAWQAMPGLIILITILGIVRRMPDVNVLLAMVVAIGVLSIAGRSRVERSAVITIRSMPYVEAARAVGSGNGRIMLTYILPNIVPIILVGATVSLGGVILAEASLSFLGFGPAGEPSWGQMLSVDGREYMRSQPGLAIWPGLCIGLAVFSFNVFGDALRDVADPRLRGSGRR